MVEQVLIDRFHAKYRVNRDSGCWEWTASTAGKGYGQIKIPRERRQIYAHQLSWLIHYGPIPSGRYVLHRCDNPRCVNPSHLFTGTAQENQQDMKAKGRSTYGERNAQSVLTEADVRSIRLLCAAGELSQQKIASLFGIQQMEVSRIHRRLRWAHVKD